MALLVGAPVKNREKSEPIEFDALMPNIISTMPRAKSAIPSGFICLSAFFGFFHIDRIMSGHVFSSAQTMPIEQA